MNKILIDRQSRSRLEDVEIPSELCDETGNVIGFFIPLTESDRGLYDWAKGEFGNREIQEARAESGGLSIEDVLKGLDKD